MNTMCTDICKLAFCFSLLFSFSVSAASKSKAKRKVPVIAPAQLVSEAREAFARGEFNKAIDKYEEVPSSAPQFLRTREELAWAYLRAEDMEKLRGLLPHLNSLAVPARWRLEGRVLSSMLHLKDCQYEKVREEISAFQVEMKTLGKTVERRLKRSAHSAYWSALNAEMREAIFKMRFVKMELRSRLVMLERQQIVESQTKSEKRGKVASNAQIFPMNGDLWEDEMFRGRGFASSACAQIHQAKVTQ